MKKRLFVAIIVLTALAVMACGLCGMADSLTDFRLLDRPDESEPDAFSSVVEIEDVEPRDLPNFSAIHADPEVIGRGDILQLSGDPGVSGNLSILGPDGFQMQSAMVDGEAMVQMTDQSPEGVYIVSLEKEGILSGFGSFRLAHHPGVWISLDREFQRPGDQASLSIVSWGIPEHLPAYVEVGQPSGMIKYALGPIEDEALLFFIDEKSPPALRDLTEKTFLLPEGLSSEIRVSVGAINEVTERYISNQVGLSMCESPSFIEGILGGETVLQALWAEGGLRTATAKNSNGNFSIEAGPGLVLLTIMQYANDLTVIESREMVVRLGCGQTINIGVADTRLDESILKAYPFLGLSLADFAGTYLVETTGDFVPQSKGSVECTSHRNHLTVAFQTEPDSPYSFNLEIPYDQSAGHYESLFHISHHISGDSYGQAEVWLDVDRIEEHKVIQGDFSSSYQGHAGQGDVKGGFNCAIDLSIGDLFPFHLIDESNTYEPNHVVGVQRKELNDHHLASMRAVPVSMTTERMSDDCRTAFLFHDLDNVNASFAGIRLSDAINGSGLRMDVNSLQGLSQWNDLMGMLITMDVGDEVIERDFSALVTGLGLDQGQDFNIFIDLTAHSPYTLSLQAWRMTDQRLVAESASQVDRIDQVIEGSVYQEFTAQLQFADLCAVVLPAVTYLEDGEDADINFQVTDLMGYPVPGLITSISPAVPECGRYLQDPPERTDSNGMVQANFIASSLADVCMDNLEFLAHTDDHSTVPREGSATIIVVSDSMMDWSISDHDPNLPGGIPQRWDFEMTISSPDESLVAEYSGSFSGREGGFMIGAGSVTVSGGKSDNVCMGFSPSTGVQEIPTSVHLSGSGSFHISAETVSETVSQQGDQFRIRIIALLLDIKTGYDNPECLFSLFIEGMAEVMLKFVLSQPHLYHGDSNGFLVNARDGEATFYHDSFPFQISINLTRTR